MTRRDEVWSSMSKRPPDEVLEHLLVMCRASRMTFAKKNTHKGIGRGRSGSPFRTPIRLKRLWKRIRKWSEHSLIQPMPGRPNCHRARSSSSSVANLTLLYGVVSLRSARRECSRDAPLCHRCFSKVFAVGPKRKLKTLPPSFFFPNLPNAPNFPFPSLLLPSKNEMRW